MGSDEQFMARCLELAKRGAKAVMPNPMVGAVLVYQNRVLAEGYHHFFGGPHAEVDCLGNISNEDEHLIAGSTLYVSLEPCCHFGKTPPCTHLILEKKIKKVVVACLDPNPMVAGKGVELLRSKGVEVITGILEKEAQYLNRRFITNQTKKRPFIILKWAETADSFIADKSQKPLTISNAACQLVNHFWRSRESAIAVGVNTVLKDNPSLTTRLVKGEHPIRVVFDPSACLKDSNFSIFDSSAQTIYLEKTDGINNWKEAMNYLWQNKQISSVIVEGGAKTLNYFIQENLWDEIRVIRNNQLNLGEGYAAPMLPKELRPKDIAHYTECDIFYYERFH